MTLAPTKTPARLFVPRYDELSLFLMSLSFLLIYFTDSDIHSIAYTMFVTEFHWQNFPFYVLLLLFLSGLAFSIYHVFTSKRKTPGQKTAMLYFAVMVNALAGFMASAHMFQESPGVLIVFPLWNIVNALILLLMYWGQIVDENAISDDNASPIEVASGSVAVIVLYLACRFFGLYWALTFSICVSYATNFSAATQRLLSLIRPKSR
jgi:hypothetical protein